MASSSKGKGKAVEIEDEHDHSLCGHDHDHDHEHGYQHVPVAHHSLGEVDIRWPVVRSEEIDEAMEHRVHFLDESKGRTQACLSEMGA